MEELRVARDYLRSEGERVRRINARYAHLTRTASDSSQSDYREHGQMARHRDGSRAAPEWVQDRHPGVIADPTSAARMPG